MSLRGLLVKTEANFYAEVKFSLAIFLKCYYNKRSEYSARIMVQREIVCGLALIFLPA